jgi:hypothetical protein
MRGQCKAIVGGFSAVILTLGLALCGCVTTHDLNRPLLGDEAQSVRQKFAGGEGIVKLHNGREVYGHVLDVEADTLRFSDEERKSEMVIPFSDIQTITAISQSRPLGFLAGVLVGGTIGAVLGGSGEPSQFISRGTGAAAGGIFGAVIGGLVGAGFDRDEKFVVCSPGAETLVIKVDRVLEQDATSIKIRFGDKDYTLPKSDCQLQDLPDGLYLKGPRTLFRKFGLPVP